MSAAELRQAAALMRSRAEAATSGDWQSRLFTVVDSPSPHAGWVADCVGESGHANAAHIASWHPAVALAVADWLEACGGNLAGIHGQQITPSAYEEQAFAVARAFLGTADD